MKKLLLVMLAVGVVFVLAACAGGTAVSEPTVSESMAEDTAVDDHSEDMAANDMTADDPSGDMTTDNHEVDTTMEGQNDNMAMDDHEVDMAVDDTANMDTMEHPAWQTIALTNAHSGEDFTLNDFAGKTVYVEPMATWCTNCRQQLNNVAQIREQFGDEVVFIGLSLETNLNSADLAAYADNQGYDWTFAVMTPEMLQALADTYGRTITNAPSTPHFIIRADGTHTDLVTGIDSPDQLVQFIQDAQS